MNGWFDFYTVPDAPDVPVKPVVGVPATVKSTQDFLEYLLTLTDASANPGFAYTRTGAIPPGTYLLAGSVPSSTAGWIVPVDGQIREMFVVAEDPVTTTFAVERRVGAVYTEIATFTLSALRKDVQSFTVDVSRGDELVTKVKSGDTPKNVIMGLSVQGVRTI